MKRNLREFDVFYVGLTADTILLGLLNWKWFKIEEA